MDRFAYTLATAFVLACMAVGATLGAVVVLVRCGVENLGSRRD